MDPGGTFFKIGRSILWIAVFLTSIDAILQFNTKVGRTFQPNPPTVNADSILEIKSLTSGSGETFLAGDCFIVEVKPIVSYENNPLAKPGHYKPFPYKKMEVCDFTPSAQCIRQSAYSVKILLTESGTEIKGTFGKMKNPYSIEKMGMEVIKYYDKCVVVTQKESSGSIPDMQFRPGVVQNVEFTVAKKIVGAYDVQNTATFKFKPATTFSENGGKFILTFPPWYSALSYEERYSFDNPFSCKSPNIGSGLSQEVVNGLDFETFKALGTYVISYEHIAGTNVDEIIIICSYFKNPITPRLSTGYSIETQDYSGQTMDITAKFSLDTRQFVPYEMLQSAIRFTLSDPVVQKASAVTYTITPDIPFEYDGCFVKFIFPPEVQITSESLKAYNGEGYMVDELGNSEIVPVDKDFSGETKWVIFKACQYNIDDSFIQKTMQVEFEDIVLPYAKRSTSPFKVEVYKQWSKAAGLTQAIIKGEKSFMDIDLFETNDVENIAMTASNYQVQEQGTHFFEFTITSVIPGIDKEANIEQALHIKFPPSLSIDKNNLATKVIQITGDGVSATDITYEEDETLNYNPDCQIEPCYTIYFKTAKTIQIGTRLKVAISNLLNPESIIIAKNVQVSTLMRYVGDEIYYKIDTATQASKFQAEEGIMDTDKIYAQSVYQNFSTFSDNQVYLISFTSVHRVYKGGYIKLEIPDVFTMSSSSSAVAQFTVQDDNGLNYVQINAVSADDLFIVGQTIVEMPENKQYTIKIGGLQNPRNLIANEDLKEEDKKYFRIKTYDQNARPIDDKINLIDQGKGGLININETSKIQSFSAESFNTTNGVDTRYFVSWFTEITTLNGDIIIIEFPKESLLVTVDMPGSTGIKCTGINGIKKMICLPQQGNPHILEIHLEELSQATGLFKLQVENIKNPPSLRGSSAFGKIKHVTENFLICSTYEKYVKIENEFASQLQGLGSYSITQNNKEYNTKANYSITFVPFSRNLVNSSKPLAILLSYPIGVKPWDDNQGCTVVTESRLVQNQTKTSLVSDCNKLEGSRLFKIDNAIPYGYDKSITININFINPIDNWGTIGLKLKTFEIYENENYIVDQLEGNELVPNLKCLTPCKECKGDTNNHDLKFCDACWQNNPIKYLMEFSPYSISATTGNSTCLSSCPNLWVDTKGVQQYGYTTNGDTKEHKCVPCDQSCATCQDNGQVGDTKKCKTCSKTHPFMFTQEARCTEQCFLGFYQLGADQCDLCSFPCQGCSGDKFNCTKCDPKGTNPALFSSIVEVSGQNVTRATCRSTCPSGYFIDRSIETSVKCGTCISPCQTCLDKGDYCLTCNGEGNKFYVYRGSCFEECPEQTAPDMTTLECIDCGPNCKKCGTMEGPNCFECMVPYLLEDGLCVMECTKPGFRPNLKGTLCVDKAEFPDIGPIFSIMGGIIVITVLIAKKLKKETEIIPSIVAMVGVIEFIAICFEVFLCAFYSNNRYLVISLIALIVLIGINIQNAWYIKTNVRAQNAQKKVRLSQKKVDRMYDESVKKEKRRAAYDKAMEKENMNEGGEEEYDLDNLSDVGDSVSQKNQSSDSEAQFDGGASIFSPRQTQKKVLDPSILKQNNIEEKNGKYYIWKQIDDRGFIKWEDAFDRTAKAIQWISLLTTFKFYRMTYSFFMGRKQFLVLYQKKKFKKMLVIQTLFSMFFVELVIVINGVMGAANLPRGNQLYVTLIDVMCLCVFLLIVEFIEIARLDKIMRTANTQGKQQRKSATACQSSEDEELSTGGSEEDDDWPDWRLMLKNVDGNRHLFEKTKFQLQLNDIEKKFELRIAESCIEFNTGTEIEKDPRQTQSFPGSPTGYKNFEGFDFRNFGETNDNCYAESKAPGGKDTKNGATYSEMGTQAQPSEILIALARKGGDLLQPNTDNDYARKGTTKKKRGRKNKYYRQIDAEDDEEADQMSDGSEDDGLDGIKEEDEEDEEERLAKLALIKAERDRTIAEYKAKEDADKKAKEDAKNAKKLADDQEAERLRKLAEDEAKKKAADNAAAKAALDEKRASDDNQSELSGMMVKSGALQAFSSKLDQQIMEVPPTVESRRFNECDILGKFDRDDKGNVIAEPDANGKFKDQDGKPTNERGYLIDENGNIINNLNGQKMFDKKDLDAKGEVPAPFNVEKHNFNPHQVRGDFDFDRNGNPMIKKTKSGEYVDKRGNKVSARGYKLDKDGNVMDHQDRTKFDKSHVQQDGDLPKFYNYNGRRFDITDIIGIVDKDENGQIIPLTDKNGNLTDNLGRRINPKGYLIDDFGNVIDKDGRQIFEKKHLYNDEVPKILPFTKFNVKNVLGDFEMDPLGNPILENVGNGKFKDRVGQKVNQKGYMTDKDGNVINQNGRTMFGRELLDNEQDIPKVFRTGLLKSDTASSLSRLMSEIGKNQPSEFDQEEQRIQEEIARNIKKKKRNHSGNTSVDSMMEDTPANYNYQNQRFNAELEDQEGEEEDEESDDEYGSQYDANLGKTGFTQNGGNELAKKRKKKKKKKKKKPAEYEDPSLREHLLAGAYGGIAKKKIKRLGVKYTTDLNAGLRDIATPGSAFHRDQSYKKMMTSFSGVEQNNQGGRESHRNRTHRRSQGVSADDSQLGSRMGAKKQQSKIDEQSIQLMNPQQREEYLKAAHMDEIKAKKMAVAKKRRNQTGKISKDADFEKMFGKDIDEFLEDSEWDIESIDKMSQFSKNSKNTIHSAAQAGKLRGLEKLYLQRIETGINKNTLQQTGSISQTNPAAKLPTKKSNKFRGGEIDEEIRKPKQAWDVASKGSRASQSVNRVFKQGKK